MPFHIYVIVCMCVCGCDVCMYLVKSRLSIQEQALFRLPPSLSPCLFGSLASPCISPSIFLLLLLLKIWNASQVCRGHADLFGVPILVFVLLEQVHSCFKDTGKRRQQSCACSLLWTSGAWVVFSWTVHGSNPIRGVWQPECISDRKDL